MANLKVEGLMGSEVLKIKAAVVEVMEKAAGVTITEDPDIKHEADKDVCQMSFNKKDSSLEELSKIQQELDDKFSIGIVHTRECIKIILTAPTAAFTRLIGKDLPKKPEGKEENQLEKL